MDTKGNNSWDTPNPASRHIGDLLLYPWYIILSFKCFIIVKHYGDIYIYMLFVLLQAFRMLLRALLSIGWRNR